MRRSASSKLLFVAALLLLLLASPAPALAKDTWTGVRSQNFYLVGNASEKEVRRVATRMEQFREVFTRLFPKVKFNSPVPTTVVVFKSDGSYKPFKPVVDGKISEVAGYFQSGLDVNYITLTTERATENPFRTIYHEYVHLLVDNNIGRAAPPWFNEGLAEYYSTFDIDDDRVVVLGRLIDNHLLLLQQQPLIPFKTFFEIDNYSLHRNKRDARGIFYAQAWALMHYLIRGNDGKRLPQMSRFIDLKLAGRPTEEAFREAFQTDFAGMEKELKRYVGQRSFTAAAITFDRKLEFESTMQTTPLSEAEAESHLGDLLLHTNRPADAVARLEKALALDPRQGLAHAALGMSLVRQHKLDDARRHLKEAVALDARNYLVHYYYAYALSRQGMNDAGFVMGYPPETAAEMRAALKRAIELKPDFAESYNLLAFVGLVTNERLDEAAEMIGRARALAPGKDEYLFVLAQIYLQQQKFDDARRLLESLAASAADPQTRSGAQSYLAQLSKIEEQRASFRAMQEESARRVSDDTDNAESSSSSSGPPRLVRRGDPDQVANNGKTTEEMVAEAYAEAMHEALRKPLDGETRVQGVLVRLDCDQKGIVFHVRAGARLLKLRSASFEGLHIMAFSQEAGGQITCGPRTPESPIIVTYRAPKDARSKSDGDAVALEFVPASFVLKQ